MQSTIEMPSANARLNRAQAAEYIGVSLATLATWATRGGGPSFIKAGGRVIYLQADVDAWMDARRVSFSAELDR